MAATEIAALKLWHEKWFAVMASEVYRGGCGGEGCDGGTWRQFLVVIVSRCSDCGSAGELSKRCCHHWHYWFWYGNFSLLYYYHYFALMLP